MVWFGFLNSVFDILTFGVLLWFFQAAPEGFRMGWFIESLLTELVIGLVVRTRRPFYHSRPENLLLVSTVIVVIIAMILPYLAFSPIFGFVPLPTPLLLSMIGLTLGYVCVVEAAKRKFYLYAGIDNK